MVKNNAQKKIGISKVTRNELVKIMFTFYKYMYEMAVRVCRCDVGQQNFC